MQNIPHEGVFRAFEKYGIFSHLIKQGAKPRSG